MSRSAVSIALLATVQALDIGDRIYRTYSEFVPLPITKAEATEQGWEPLNDCCVPGLGYPYHLANRTDNTTILYYARNGQVAGASADVFGAPPPEKLIDAGYWVEVGNNTYRLELAYRSPRSVCHRRSPYKNTLGDRIVINPRGVRRSLPLTRSAAKREGWVEGSCFYGMGTHWFFDLEGHKKQKMTWKAENLLPIVVMFNNNDEIQSTFWASWTVQQTPEYEVDWEPIPLPDAFMCMNMCSEDCTFAGTDIWSTYHLIYRDLNLGLCADGCTIGCCP